MSESRRQDHHHAEVVARLQLPLENLAFTLDSYLSEDTGQLDPRTRDMLIALREGIHRAALTAKALGAPPAGAKERRGPAIAAKGTIALARRPAPAGY